MLFWKWLPWNLKVANRTSRTVMGKLIILSTEKAYSPRVILHFMKWQLWSLFCTQWLQIDPISALGKYNLSSSLFLWEKWLEQVDFVFALIYFLKNWYICLYIHTLVCVYFRPSFRRKKGKNLWIFLQHLGRAFLLFPIAIKGNRALFLPVCIPLAVMCCSSYLIHLCTLLPSAKIRMFQKNFSSCNQLGRKFQLQVESWPVMNIKAQETGGQWKKK